MKKLPKLINYPDMQVIMRKDFYNNFDAQLKKITEDTGAIYFGHNIIKNYREGGHRVSTFCNHESWHEIYWEKYRNDDPTEKIVHRAIQENYFAASSWKVDAAASPCIEERLKLTTTNDGITFSFKRKENYQETFSLGWKTLKAKVLDTDYMLYLASLLKPIRDYHWEVHEAA